MKPVSDKWIERALQYALVKVPGEEYHAKRDRLAAIKALHQLQSQRDAIRKHQENNRALVLRPWDSQLYFAVLPETRKTT